MTICFEEKNIEVKYAPVNNHKGIELVEGLNQTVKHPLSSMKAHLVKKFCSSTSKTCNYCKPLTKQKTTILTTFEVHFGRNTNTAKSITVCKPDSKHLYCHTRTIVH